MDQNEILRYVASILRFCKRRLSNSNDAENLASEIILHILLGMLMTVGMFCILGDYRK